LARSSRSCTFSRVPLTLAHTRRRVGLLIVGSDICDSELSVSPAEHKVHAGQVLACRVLPMAWRRSGRPYRPCRTLSMSRCHRVMAVCETFAWAYGSCVAHVDVPPKHLLILVTTYRRALFARHSWRRGVDVVIKKREI
jgi:hypothetical protein